MLAVYSILRYSIRRFIAFVGPYSPLISATAICHCYLLRDGLIDYDEFIGTLSPFWDEDFSGDGYLDDIPEEAQDEGAAGSSAMGEDAGSSELGADPSKNKIMV
jgi:hypothetical protein